jgi:TonB family protein
MKKFIFIPVFCLISNFVFSQFFKYEHTGSRAAVIKRDDLVAAKLISDLVPGHPKRYDYNLTYVSIEISAICDGKTITSISTNDQLSTDQKTLINRADLGTEIMVKMTIAYKDVASANGEDKKTKVMEYVLTPGPEIEAEFPGGRDEMERYLNESVVIRMTDQKSLVNNSGAVVNFIINEEGQIAGAKIVRPSTNPELDQLLLKAIAKMPAWRPAGNSKSVKIKQEFNISFGGGC